METVLVIGASGRIGSKLVEELDANHQGITVRLSSSRPDVAAQWRREGRDAVVLDLGEPDGFAAALEGVDRVFLLTGYTADMLYQSKMLIDAATAADVSHVVHLGVFSSGRDQIPHYAWHDLIETYLQASGIAWTNLHPNVIIDTTLDTDPPVTATRTFGVMWGEAPVGWVSAADIAAVAAAVLREGPAKHGGADYWLSSEVATGPEVAQMLSKELGVDITCTVGNSQQTAAYAAQIPSAADRLYLESAADRMRQAELGRMEFDATVHDDVQTALGRPGTTITQWARENLRTTD